MFEMIKFMIKNRKGGEELSQLAKMLIYLALLLVLLWIVMYYIVPNLGAQETNIKDTINLVK